MSANVETMFSLRRKPWHGLGTIVNNELTSEDAIKAAGLDWLVIQKKLKTFDNITIPGYMANIRETDNKLLGVVASRYNVVQNSEAFNFTDLLLGEGVTYETAGSLYGGKRIWLLAKVPEMYKIAGENYENYLIFTSGHDGTNPVKVSLTPVRVVCNNTLQIALNTSKRIWTVRHTSKVLEHYAAAKAYLIGTKKYTTKLSNVLESSAIRKYDENKMVKTLDSILSKNKSLTESSKENHKLGIFYIYKNAPDLMNLDHNGYRLINAISDYTNHRSPRRYSPSWRETIFTKAIDGDRLLNDAYSAINELV